MTAMIMLIGLLSQPAATPGPILHVDFQEGFEGWVAVLMLDGIPVFRDSVRTDPVKGLACGTDLECRSTLVDLRVRIREIGLDSTFHVAIGDGEFAGLTAMDAGGGDIVLRMIQSTTPFGYD